MADGAGDAADPPAAPEMRQEVHAARGSAVYVTMDGDMHIHGGGPPYRLSPHGLERESADTGVAHPPGRGGGDRSGDGGDTAEQAMIELVTDTLTCWRDTSSSSSSSPDLCVTLLCTAGQAHAAETVLDAVVRSSVAAGWTVVAVHHDLLGRGERAEPAPSDPTTLLAVVQGADLWPADNLLMLLQDPILAVPDKARVLLVAVEAGAWWSSLRHRMGKAEIPARGAIRVAGRL